jgi:predicted nucleic acid-binding Zn ribbon protein
MSDEDHGLVPEAKGFGGRRRPRSDDAVALGDVVDGLMREEVFSRGMPIAQLASRWPQVVGERLAGETAPAALEAGVLTVQVSSGPWGAQAEFLHEEIRRKADEALGGGTVDRVRIVVRNPR